jgi:hypothetical protein
MPSATVALDPVPQAASALIWCLRPPPAAAALDLVPPAVAAFNLMPPATVLDLAWQQERTGDVFVEGISR